MKDNRLILKSLQRFRCQKHNVFREKINKISLSVGDDKRIQSINSMKTYAYKTNKEINQKKKKQIYQYNETIQKLMKHVTIDNIKKNLISPHLDS